MGCVWLKREIMENFGCFLLFLCRLPKSFYYLFEGLLLFYPIHFWKPWLLSIFIFACPSLLKNKEFCAVFFFLKWNSLYRTQSKENRVKFIHIEQQRCKHKKPSKRSIFTVWNHSGRPNTMHDTERQRFSQKCSSRIAVWTPKSKTAFF